MHLPQAAQLVEDRLRQRHSTFLVALANDADQPVDAIDCGHFECRSLADAQAACIHEQKGRSRDRLPYTAEDCASFRVRWHIGQTLALGRTDSFFENSDHSRSSVWAKKKRMPP